MRYPAPWSTSGTRNNRDLITCCAIGSVTATVSPMHAATMRSRTAAGASSMTGVSTASRLSGTVNIRNVKTSVAGRDSHLSRSVRHYPMPYREGYWWNPESGSKLIRQQDSPGNMTPYKRDQTFRFCYLLIPFVASVQRHRCRRARCLTGQGWRVRGRLRYRSRYGTLHHSL